MNIMPVSRLCLSMLMSLVRSKNHFTFVCYLADSLGIDMPVWLRIHELPPVHKQPHGEELYSSLQFLKTPQTPAQ